MVTYGLTHTSCRSSARSLTKLTSTSSSVRHAKRGALRVESLPLPSAAIAGGFGSTSLIGASRSPDKSRLPLDRLFALSICGRRREERAPVAYPCGATDCAPPSRNTIANDPSSGLVRMDTTIVGIHPKFSSKGAFNLIRIGPHVDFSLWPQIYLPTSQNYVHEQNYECSQLCCVEGEKERE